MTELKYKAESVVKNHVLFATGAGAIPIPLVDFAGVTAVQLDMMKKLTNLYGNNYSENVGKAFIASITSTSLARMGASAIKAIPGVGSLIGGFSMSIMSGASTFALGNVIISFYERGISIEDIDVDTAKEIYEEELEKGKKVAEDLKEKAKNEPKPSASSTSNETPPSPSKTKIENDIYSELTKLGELKEKGIITEEEFLKMKKEIIDKF